MGKQSFERKLEALELLRSAPEPEALEGLSRALKQSNNYAVGKAAAIVALRGFTSLLPELLTAFERFIRDPVKSDPQCWAKNAICRALVDLQHNDSAVFLQGIVHEQWEPVFGGREDTAATLRGICALALVSCNLPAFQLLEHFTDLLNDAKWQVRVDATRAVAQLSAWEGSLPLRLKVLLGDPEPAVIGACFAALLALSPIAYLPFVEKHLSHPDPDIQIEAAAVLIESHEPQAFAQIAAFWERQTSLEAKQSLLTFLSNSPNDAAPALLLSIIDSAPERLAIEAMRAMSGSRHAVRFREQIDATVQSRGSALLREALRSAPDTG